MAATSSSSANMSQAAIQLGFGTDGKAISGEIFPAVKLTITPQGFPDIKNRQLQPGEALRHCSAIATNLLPNSLQASKSINGSLEV
jgi:hypothetical protein